MNLDVLGLKEYIERMGLKQRYISEKTGIPTSSLCLILNGKRKCEVGEYAAICNAIGVDMRMFIKRKAG